MHKPEVLTSVPRIAPAKTQEVILAASVELNPHSSFNIVERKERSIISIESAMKQNPAAARIRC